MDATSANLLEFTCSDGVSCEGGIVRCPTQTGIITDTSCMWFICDLYVICIWFPTNLYVVSIWCLVKNTIFLIACGLFIYI